MGTSVVDVIGRGFAWVTSFVCSCVCHLFRGVAVRVDSVPLPLAHLVGIGRAVVASLRGHTLYGGLIVRP